jgi:hypothetical protein
MEGSRSRWSRQKTTKSKRTGGCGSSVRVLPGKLKALSSVLSTGRGKKVSDYTLKTRIYFGFWFLRQNTCDPPASASHWNYRQVPHTWLENKYICPLIMTP